MRKSAHVLLVDDNADDRELAMLAFREVGLHEKKVVACETAEQALEKLTKWQTGNVDASKLPSLILVDIKLPRGDGFQVLQAVRSHAATSFIPVVMLSNSSEEADLIRSYQLGANSYLRKPVGFDHFVEIAQALGTYWLGLNETPRMT